MFWQFYFLRHTQKLSLGCGALSELIVSPAEKSAVLQTACTNLISLMLELATLIFISDPKGVSHPIILCCDHLRPRNLAVQDNVPAIFEAN